MQEEHIKKEDAPLVCSLADNLLRELKDRACQSLTNCASQGEKLCLSKMLAQFDHVRVLIVGASGAGKSSFVAGLTGHPIPIGHVFPTTPHSTGYVCGRITFIDVKGFEDWGPEEIVTWKRTLEEGKMEDKVHLAFVLHNAAHRCLPKQLTQIMTVLLQRRIPFCSVVTNPYSASSHVREIVCGLKKVMVGAAKTVPVDLIPSSWKTTTGATAGSLPPESQIGVKNNVTLMPSAPSADLSAVPSTAHSTVSDSKRESGQATTTRDIILNPPVHEVNSTEFAIIDRRTGEVSKYPPHGTDDLIRFVLNDCSLRGDLAACLLLSIRHDLSWWSRLMNSTHTSFAKLILKFVPEDRAAEVEMQLLHLDPNSFHFWQMLKITFEGWTKRPTRATATGIGNVSINVAAADLDNPLVRSVEEDGGLPCPDEAKHPLLLEDVILSAQKSIEETEQYKLECADLTRKVEELKSELECVICFQAPRSCILRPCKHLVCCQQCLDDPRLASDHLCPLCRAPYTSTEHVFH